MGNILEFRVPQRPPQAGSASGAPPGPAEIVMFTGIRYEHHSVPEQLKPEPMAADGGHGPSHRGSTSS